MVHTLLQIDLAVLCAPCTDLTSLLWLEAHAPHRRSPTIARWVAGLGERVVRVPFRVVDLLDLGLQLDDEAGIPVMHGHERVTTRAWGEIVSGAAGVVM